MMHTALMLLLLAAPPQNLIANSSMQRWHESHLRPLGWGVWTPDALRTSWQVARDRAVTRDGDTSMRVTVADWVNVFTAAPVEPGKTYTYSIHVRCDQPVKVAMRLSVWGDGVSPDEREKNRKQPQYDITPGAWQRIAVTDTMPPGAQRVTAYVFLRGAGVYHLDAAMLNVGDLTDYAPGVGSRTIAPLVGSREPGEVAFTPRRWDADGETVTDQEVAFAFDADVMSDYRLRNFPGSIGATFDQPVTLRGLALLLHEPGEAEGVSLAVQVKREGVWADRPHERKPVGVVSLLAFEPIEVEAIRIRFTTSRKALRIYHMGFAQ